MDNDTSDNESTDMEHILEKARAIFYKDPNVIGMRIGPPRQNNEIQFKEYALLVYVADKLSAKDIDPSNIIPKEFMGLKTDVIDPLSYFSSNVFDVDTQHAIADDLRSIDWGRLHASSLPNASQVQNLIGIVRDYGDICVVEDDGTFVKKKSDGSDWVDYLEPYRLFRTLHGDDYDFITFFPESNFPLSTSFSVGIFNDVQGIGGTYDNRNYWKSVRLQQFHSISIQHFSCWRQTMLQEFGHRWACRVNYKDPTTGMMMTDHRLNWSLLHWSNELDDDKSPMDYNWYEWTELPNGQFRRVPITSDQYVYSRLDLYLMGLCSPNEVGEFKILRDPQPVIGSPTDFTANPVTLTVQDFINQEGNRNPSSFQSSREWRQAFVILTKDIDQVQNFVNTVEALRNRWSNDFMEATEGLGKVDTFLSTMPRLTHIPNMKHVAGYYPISDQQQHAIIATDSRVHEVWWNASLGEQGSSTQWHGHAIRDSSFVQPHWEGVLINDTPSNIVAIAAYYSNDDQYQHVIVAISNGKIREYYWNTANGGEVSWDNLPVEFTSATASIVSVAGYYSNDDQYQHVIVATSNGKVREIYWKSGGVGAGQDDLPVQFSAGSIVSVAGYYSNDDQYQHVIVATSNGKVREIYWKSGGVGAGQDDLPVQFSAGSIDAVAGYYATSDQRQHVILATSDGKVHDVFWKSGGVGGGHCILANFNPGSILTIAGYYAENDYRQHVIVGTQDDNIHDLSFISHL